MLDFAGVVSDRASSRRGQAARSRHAGAGRAADAAARGAGRARRCGARFD